MSSPSNFAVEHLSTNSSEGTSALSDLLAHSNDVLSEHKGLQLATPGTLPYLGVTRQGQLIAAAIHATHGDVVNLELIARPGEEHARMVVFDAAMVDLEGREVQLWEPTTGLSVELEEAISRYDVEQVRTLLQLTRELAAHPPAPTPTEVHTFNAERDSDRWIAANNLAFADHREQGAWTAETLRERIGQAWFDPSLFLIHGDGEISAWCWCKIDQALGTTRGEIYVIGTAPAAQGRGLGRVMLERGCEELRIRGVQFVDLYVDGDNTAALALYQRAAFTEIAKRRSWLFS